ncbi:MAG: phage virion morphogenesis protein [Flavobacterium lindanitolerans]|uniref:phage virion morphogenesis protein n=1 Tax=Flavobacterium lindanitolerans TaxID=428988 RepID=UPI001A56E940|nr:phage virion morphogenesis protein [Flavobacterium lindanitolerans]MBL7868869.1 phage virion morphogenesis protein [Flavobacterium lindanitolerans]
MSSNIFAKLKKLQRVHETFVPKAAIVAVNFSKERFVQKNWVDRSRQNWEPRKRKDRGSLMVKTGRLKRSIRKIRVGSNYFIIGTDVPYAQAHNDGLTINRTVTVKPHQRAITRGRNPRRVNIKMHQRKMQRTFKKRQFLGESAVLMRRIERMLENDIKEALK